MWQLLENNKKKFLSTGDMYNIDIQQCGPSITSWKIYAFLVFIVLVSVPEEPTGETDCSTYYVLSEDNK